MGQIALHEVTKVFKGEKLDAVHEVSLQIDEGEFLVLVGPSGCGKSTLLRMIAGIETVSSGTIEIDGDDATHALPKDRDIAMVFQNYALYPHMTVEENLDFALRLRKMSRDERRRRLSDVMRTLRLDQLARRRPSELSGGQRQRVAMGRAMVREPTACLMDEPLSNLDSKLRVAMRSELARLHEHLATTTVYVTHDQTEAMTLGRRVAVLRDGVLQQVASPHVLYHAPCNLFVASFIGSPSINLVEAEISDGHLHFGKCAVELPSHAELGSRSSVVLGIRPGDFQLAEQAPSYPQIPVRLEVVEDLGAELHVIFPLGAPRVNPEATGGALEGAEAGDEQLLAEERALFTAALPARKRLVAGQDVRLSIDVSRLMFFDSESGEALGRAVTPEMSAAKARPDEVSR